MISCGVFFTLWAILRLIGERFLISGRSSSWYTRQFFQSRWTLNSWLMLHSFAESSRFEFHSLFPLGPVWALNQSHQFVFALIIFILQDHGAHHVDNITTTLPLDDLPNGRHSTITVRGILWDWDHVRAKLFLVLCHLQIYWQFVWGSKFIVCELSIDKSIDWLIDRLIDWSIDR